jgi:hypothetical protein
MFARNNTNDMDIHVNLTLTLEVWDDRRLDRKWIRNGLRFIFQHVSLLAPHSHGF